MGWFQVTPGVTLNNITPSNNLLLNSYFKIFTVGYIYGLVLSYTLCNSKQYYTI